MEVPRPLADSAGRDLDTATFESFRVTAELDRSLATAEDKAQSWRRFAQQAPGHPGWAQERAAEWERCAARMQAITEAVNARIAARDADWMTLGPLLKEEGIPKAAKRRWAEDFVAAYGKTPGLDPALAKELVAHLAAGAMRDALQRVAAQAPEGAAPRAGGMALIPAGVFWMGSPEGVGGSDEHPRHKVDLDAFYMDRYMVTLAQYREFSQATGRPMPGQPPRSGPDHPVGNVGWADARAYCEWAGKRLPTEAQWEKAARGGTDTTFSFGDDESDLGGYAWYRANSWNQMHLVGQKKPNQYGLYDMAGNAWEWVADWYDEDYYGISPGRDPQGPPSGFQHGRRGGCWDNDAYRCRPANRVMPSPVQAAGNWGFRCASDGKNHNIP